MTTEQSGFLRRIEDLSERCERQSVVAATAFLTPAEQYNLHAWADRRTVARLFLSGGQEGCERQRAFFLPYWLTPEDLDLGEHIRAIRADAFFGEPGHRDYLGAVLGLGIQREWIGDIRVFGASAYLFCLPSVESLLLDELRKVGRVSVRSVSVSLEDVPAPERRAKKVSFTVKSLRLDAVLGSLFGLSRTQAAELIRMGAASLNYASCERTDAPVKEGDVISPCGVGARACSPLSEADRERIACSLRRRFCYDAESPHYIIHGRCPLNQGTPAFDIRFRCSDGLGIDRTKPQQLLPSFRPRGIRRFRKPVCHRIHAVGKDNLADNQGRNISSC